MSKPEQEHMISYLQRLGIDVKHLSKKEIETVYFCNIYQVATRETTLNKTLSQSGQHP